MPLQQGRTLNSTESLPKSILAFLNLVSPKISTSPGLGAKTTQLSKYSQILQQRVRMLTDPRPYKHFLDLHTRTKWWPLEKRNKQHLFTIIFWGGILLLAALNPLSPDSFQMRTNLHLVPARQTSPAASPLL